MILIVSVIQLQQCLRIMNHNYSLKVNRGLGHVLVAPLYAQLDRNMKCLKRFSIKSKGPKQEQEQEQEQEQ